MAISHQSTAGQNLTDNDGGTTGSLAVTVDAAGADRILVVRVGGEGNGSGTIQVSSMTYNGDALTRILRANNATWSWAEVWILVNPDTGTNTLSVTLSSGDTYGLRADVYQGVDQSTPNRTVQTQTGNGTAPSVTVSGVASGDEVLDVVCRDGGGVELTAGADQTEEAELAPSGCDLAFSRQDGASGGTMSYSWTGSNPFSYGAVALIPAAGAGDQSITVPLVDAGRAVYEPTVTPGAVSVAPALVDAGRAVNSPTITPGAVTISPDLVDAGRAVYEPTVTPDGAVIAPALVDAGREVYEPALSVGAVSIAPPLVDAGREVFTPTVTGGEEPESTGGLTLLKAG